MNEEDKLKEIRIRYGACVAIFYEDASGNVYEVAADDISWLIAEVRRLRALIEQGKGEL